MRPPESVVSPAMVGGIVTSDAAAVLTSCCGCWNCDCDCDWGIGTPTLGVNCWTCVVEASSDLTTSRVNIDGGDPPCSDANDRACCKPARALASARARCEAADDEAEDDVLRARAAAAAAAAEAAPLLLLPLAFVTKETGERRVVLSSVRARIPARRGNALPAPPTTGIPKVWFSGLLSAPPSLALASASTSASASSRRIDCCC